MQSGEAQGQQDQRRASTLYPIGETVQLSLLRREGYGLGRVKLVHACQKRQHRGADILSTVRKEVGARMAVIVIEGDDRSFRESRHGL